MSQDRRILLKFEVTVERFVSCNKLEGAIEMALEEVRVDSAGYLTRDRLVSARDLKEG
jgi:hypothetical protein